MANRSSKSQGGRNQGGQNDQSSTSNRMDQGTDAQNCPTPGERRDSSISDISDEEEE